MLTEAIRIALMAHHGQTDKSGQPYILHPLRVMMAMENDTDRVVAVLHDAVEDCDAVGHGDILAFFGEEVHAAVFAITRQKGETYAAFIDRCKANEIARRVKLADIADNLSEERMDGLTESLRARYHAARRALEGE